jgi:hypothetical protein
VSQEAARLGNRPCWQCCCLQVNNVNHLLVHVLLSSLFDATSSCARWNPNTAATRPYLATSASSPVACASSSCGCLRCCLSTPVNQSPSACLCSRYSRSSVWYLSSTACSSNNGSCAAADGNSSRRDKHR